VLATTASNFNLILSILSPAKIPLDNPKSVNLICPFAPTKKFSGFKSRWM
jgi:hypothetical protein